MLLTLGKVKVKRTWKTGIGYGHAGLDPTEGVRKKICEED